MELVRLLPDDVPTRVVVADPEVPLLPVAERGAGAGADRARAAHRGGGPPDELRVVAAPGAAGVGGVVVVLRLGGPSLDHALRSARAGREEGADVLAQVAAVGVVAEGAPVRPLP